MGKQVMKDSGWQRKGASLKLAIFLVPNKCERKSPQGDFKKASAALEMCPNLWTF